MLRSLLALVPPRYLQAVARLQWRHPLLRRAYLRGVALLRDRDGVISHGPGKGLRFNAGNANAGYAVGTSEPVVQRLLAELLRPGMTFYDAGANVGFFSILAARLVGPTGRVVCFEPLPRNADQIEHNARLNAFGHVQVERCALSDHDGSASFVVAEDPTWGTLAESGHGVDGVAGHIDVMVRTLDQLVEERAFPAPDLVKIDVEGAEARLLSGAAEIIRRAGPILLIELHGTNAAVDAELRALDYVAEVLGGGGVIGARWEAYVLAVPAGRADTARRVRGLASMAESAR